MRTGPIAIVADRKGGWRAYIYGYPDDHLMDYRGCNYHVKALSRRAWPTQAAAEQFIRDTYPTRQALDRYAHHAGDGTFMRRDFGPYEEVVLPKEEPDAH